MSDIGLRNEKPLHAALKEWYRQAGDGVEVPFEGFVVDLVRDELLIEIQTRGFSGMRNKLRKLLDLGHRVRIVHPIAESRWIVKVDEGGRQISRRRSPKRGSIEDVCSELVSFPTWLDETGLEVEVLLTHEEEVRTHQPGKAWRRGGWVVVERRLIGVIDGRVLSSADDLIALLPDGLDEEFTTADMAAAAGRPRRVAQQMAYCLRESGAIEIAGKQGNALVYRVA